MLPGAPAAASQESHAMATEPSPVPPTPSADAAKPRPAAQSKRRPHEVVFITYPKLLFTWPLILAGYLFWPLAYAPAPVPPPAEAPATSPAPAETGAAAQEPVRAPLSAPGVSPRLERLGWAYLWIALIVLIAMGLDFNRNHSAFLIVLAVAIWMAGLWLHDRHHFTLFGDIYRWFARLDVQYDRSLGLTLSILLTIPYLVMLVWGRLNDYWRITHNEFEHYSFGRVDDALGRGAKTIRTEFPDMFELLLGLAGTLIVFNATGTQELRRIQHVMFLPFVRRRLNQVLERVAVDVVQTMEEEETQV